MPTACSVHSTRSPTSSVRSYSFTVAELSVADTAAVLGKRPGAVKTLHRRVLDAAAHARGGDTVSGRSNAARRQRSRALLSDALVIEPSTCQRCGLRPRRRDERPEVRRSAGAATPRTRDCRARAVQGAGGGRRGRDQPHHDDRSRRGRARSPNRRTDRGRRRALRRRALPNRHAERLGTCGTSTDRPPAASVAPPAPVRQRSLAPHSAGDDHHATAPDHDGNDAVACNCSEALRRPQAVRHRRPVRPAAPVSRPRSPIRSRRLPRRSPATHRRRSPAEAISPRLTAIIRSITTIPRSVRRTIRRAGTRTRIHTPERDADRICNLRTW